MQAGLPDHAQCQRLPACLAARDDPGGISPGVVGEGLVIPDSHICFGKKTLLQ